MLKTRVIPTLLHKNFGMVKGAGFDSRRRVGGALQFIKVFSLRGVDELVFLDIAATLEKRPPDFEIVDDLADECFMPFTAGGGVRSAEDVQQMLQVGADKVAFNTAAFWDTDIVLHSAHRFGSQCIVVSVDYRLDEDGTRKVFTHSGTMPTGMDLLEYISRVEDAGAGEILLTCIERDGTMRGYDVEGIRLVSDRVRIPVIASGGAGNSQHMIEAVNRGGASAVAAASIFHFTEITPRDIKEELTKAGIPVRLS